MSKLNIFCVTHKNIEIPKISSLKLIQVGNETENFADLRDNLNDNIANKNTSYSELTAFYYVWKNLPSPMVGFCHYRRYLIPPILNQWIKQKAIKLPAGSNSLDFYFVGSGFVISDRELFDRFTQLNQNYQDSFIQALENCDILLPSPHPLGAGGFTYHYFTCHPSAPFFRMLSILSEIDNQMGIMAHNFFLQSKQAFWNNLFITRWEIFELYSEFLFEVLSRLEKEIELPQSKYQQRVFAFLSERLFNFWVWYKKLKVGTLNWCILESALKNKESHHRK